MDGFSTACDNFGLTISTKKAEVMYQSAPGNPYQDNDITVKGKRLQAVENFTYLSSTRQQSPKSMPKSPTALLNPAAHSENWRRPSGSDEESHTALKSKSTGQSCYPLSSTAVKPGLSTGDMRNNSTSFISGVYVALSTSTGRTRSRTPRCWRAHSSPGSSLPCARHRNTGQVTSSKCQPSEYPSSCCTVNLAKGQGR